MPQPPFKSDQFQVDTTTGTGTRLINRNTTDDSLQFSDPVVSSAVRLLDLVGVRNITGIALVGRSGDGAGYTAIQDAIDAAPTTATQDEPHVILVHSGRYEENLVIEKDGLVIQGLGGVTIANPAATADATITVQEGATVPLDLILKDLVIENAEDGESCIRVDGTDTFASGTVTINTAPLAATDTVTIGGTALTGVSGARTSGNDDFSVDGPTTSDIATEIAAAINDPANSFSATVTASALVNVVTITAVAAGAGGNAITLAVATTPVGGMTASGATLTGGGAPPTLLSNDGLRVLDCRILATGIGTYQLRASIANNIAIRGGTFFGSSSSSKVLVSQCAAFRMGHVGWTNDFELAYDTGATLPVIPTSAYTIGHVRRANDFLVNLLGEGSLSLSHLSAGTVSQGGDRALDIKHSDIGDLTLSDATVATLVHTSRGTAAVGAGTPTLAENTLVDSVTWPAATSVPYVFAVPQPDASYAVHMEAPGSGLVVEITAKTAAGFTASTTGASSATTFFTVARQL